MVAKTKRVLLSILIALTTMMFVISGLLYGVGNVAFANDPITVDYSNITVHDVIREYNGGNAITPTVWDVANYHNAINVTEAPTSNFAYKFAVTATNGLGGYIRLFGDAADGSWTPFDGPVSKGVIFNFAETAVGNIQFAGLNNGADAQRVDGITDLVSGAVFEFGSFDVDSNNSVAYLKVNDTVIASVEYAKGTYSFGTYIGFGGNGSGTTSFGCAPIIDEVPEINYSNITVHDVIREYNGGANIETGSWSINNINIGTAPTNNFAYKMQVNYYGRFGGDPALWGTSAQYLKFFGATAGAWNTSDDSNIEAGQSGVGLIITPQTITAVNYVGGSVKETYSVRDGLTSLNGDSTAIIEVGSIEIDTEKSAIYVKIDDAVVIYAEYVTGSYVFGNYISMGSGNGGEVYTNAPQQIVEPEEPEEPEDLPDAPTTIDYTNITVYDVIGDLNGGEAVTPSPWNTTSYDNLVNLTEVPTSNFAYRLQVDFSSGSTGGYVRMFGDEADGSWAPFDNNADRTAVTKGIIFAFATNKVANIQFAGLTTANWLSGAQEVTGLSEVSGKFCFEFGCYDYDEVYSIAYLKVNDTIIASVAYAKGSYSFGTYIGIAGGDGGATFEQIESAPTVDYTKINKIYDFNEVNNGVLKTSVSTAYWAPTSFAIPEINNAIKFNFETAGFDGGMQLFATSDTGLWTGAIYLGSNGDYQNNFGGTSIREWVSGWSNWSETATFEIGIYQNGDNYVIYLTIDGELRFYYEATGEVTYGNYINMYSSSGNEISAVEEYVVDYDTVEVFNVADILGETEIDLATSGVYNLGSLTKNANVAFKFRYYVGDTFDGANFRQFGFLQDDSDNQPIWTGTGFEMNFYYNGSGANCSISKGGAGFGGFAYGGFVAGALLNIEFGTYDLDSQNAYFYVGIDGEIVFIKSYAKDSVTLDYGVAAQVTEDTDANIRVLDAEKYLIDEVVGDRHAYHVVDNDGFYTLSSNSGNFAFDLVSGVAQLGYYKVGTKLAVTGNVVANALFIDFSLVNGAQAKLTGKVSGLRFKGQINTEDYNKYAEYITEVGMAFIPVDYLNADGSDFMFKNFVIGETISKLALTQDFTIDGDYNSYFGVFGNIRRENYNRNFAARGYIAFNFVDGIDYIYTAFNVEDNSRNIAYLLKGTYDALDDTQREIADKMLNNIIKVTYDGEDASAVAGLGVDNVLESLETEIIDECLNVVISTNENYPIYALSINGDCIAINAEFKLFDGSVYKVKSVTRNSDNTVTIVCYPQVQLELLNPV